MSNERQFCGRTRREMLWQTGAGFPAAALAGMLGNDFLSRQTRAPARRARRLRERRAHRLVRFRFVAL